MTAPDVRIEPQAPKGATSIHLATARLNIWEGSVRSTKTVSSVEAWLDFVRTGPAGDLFMGGRSERTLVRNVINPLVDRLGVERCRYLAGAGELWLLGRRVYVAGGNDERSQERLRGMTLAGAYVDEASTVPESWWTMLVSRLSLDGARLFATTNPDGPSHWLKRRWLDKAALHLPGEGRAYRIPCTDCGATSCPPTRCDNDERLDLARFSFRLTDNPFLPEHYRRNLAREYVGLWYRRFVLGEWVVAAGAVFDMFDPVRHVVDGLPDGEAIVRDLGVGVDYGTRNPFAAVRLALTDRGRLYVPGEWGHDPASARRQMTNSDYSRGLRAWMAKHRPGGGWVCVDPSAAGFKAELYRDGVPHITDADNAVLDGIRTVAALLGNDQLVIDRRAASLLDELPGYSWDDKAAARGQDQPVKVADHFCDGLRYVAETTEPLWRPHLAAA